MSGFITEKVFAKDKMKFKIQVTINNLNNFQGFLNTFFIDLKIAINGFFVE